MRQVYRRKKNVGFSAVQIREPGTASQQRRNVGGGGITPKKRGKIGGLRVGRMHLLAFFFFEELPIKPDGF